MKYRKTLERQRDGKRGFWSGWKNKDKPKAEKALGTLGMEGGRAIRGLRAGTRGSWRVVMRKSWWRISNQRGCVFGKQMEWSGS